MVNILKVPELPEFFRFFILNQILISNSQPRDKLTAKIRQLILRNFSPGHSPDLTLQQPDDIPIPAQTCHAYQLLIAELTFPLITPGGITASFRCKKGTLPGSFSLLASCKKLIHALMSGALSPGRRQSSRQSRSILIRNQHCPPAILKGNRIHSLKLLWQLPAQKHPIASRKERSLIPGDQLISLLILTAATAKQIPQSQQILLLLVTFLFLLLLIKLFQLLHGLIKFFPFHWFEKIVMSAIPKHGNSIGKVIITADHQHQWWMRQLR